MTEHGKDAYHAFHTTLGTAAVPAFERLPAREREAWGSVEAQARYSRWLAEEYKREAQRHQKRAEDLECKIGNLQDTCNDLRAEIGKLQTEARQTEARPKRRKTETPA